MLSIGFLLFLVLIFFDLIFPARCFEKREREREREREEKREFQSVSTSYLMSNMREDSRRGGGGGGGGRKARENKRPRKKIVLISEDDIRKKDYHFEKRLKQSIKQACKFEVRKITRRLGAALNKSEEGGGDDGSGSGNGSEITRDSEVEKLRGQLNSAKELDVDAFCEVLKCRLEGDLGKGESNNIENEAPDAGNANNTNSSVASPPSTATSSSSSSAAAAGGGFDAVGQRVAKHKCVREAIEEWKAGRERLDKRMQVQQERERQASIASEGSSDAKEGNGNPSRERERKNKKSSPSPKKDQQLKVQKKPPKKKNKMGQRARRLLAEKKYGWQANHLKVVPNPNNAFYDEMVQRSKEESKGEEKGGSWSAEAKAKTKTSGKGDKGDKNRLSGTSSGGGGGRERKEEGGRRGGKDIIHPSWQAKKLAQQKLAHVEAKGKKIVFE